jgi:hypothetical protein
MPLAENRTRPPGYTIRKSLLRQRREGPAPPVAGAVAAQDREHALKRTSLQRSSRSAPAYSGFATADFSTLAHLSVSRSQTLPNCSGVRRIGRPPTSARRAFMCGSAGPALISRLSVATTCAGGNSDPDPAAHLVARHGLTDGRHVRHRVGSRRAGDGERAQRAALDMRQRGGHRANLPWFPRRISRGSDPPPIHPPYCLGGGSGLAGDRIVRHSHGKGKTTRIAR